jgi:hypothetical protein
LQKNIGCVLIGKLNMEKIQNKIVPVLVILLIVASFFIGSMYTKVKMLEKGTTTANNPGQVAGTQAEPTPAPISMDLIKNVFVKAKSNSAIPIKKLHLLKYQIPVVHIVQLHQVKMEH